MEPRSTSLPPRWLSGAVGLSAVIASALVAVSGYSPGVARFVPELNLISSEPPPWVQPHPFGGGILTT
jgi:hypothetical protein